MRLQNGPINFYLEPRLRRDRLREDSFVPHTRYRNGKFIYLHAEFTSVEFMKASRRRYAKAASSSDLNMERAYGWKTLM